MTMPNKTGWFLRHPPGTRVGFDDIRHVRSVDDAKYTFVYPMNEHTYGIRAEDIVSVLSRGKDAFVIVSDLRTVAAIKRHFGILAVSLFVFRNLSGSQLKALLVKRSRTQGAQRSDGGTRLNRLYLMQRQYVKISRSSTT